MSTNKATCVPYKVKDISLAARGRKEIELAEVKIGVELTELRSDQADYFGVKQESPFKPEYHRY